MKTLNGMFIFFITALLATPVFAATVGSITISGTVPAATSIVVSPAAGSNALDLTASPVDSKVADVTESSNTANGYKVTMSSANAGLLKNGNLGSLAYTAKYNNSSAVLSVNPVTVTNQGASNVPVNVTKPLAISYSGLPSAQMMVGTYSDTLTFTITAN